MDSEATCPVVAESFLAENTCCNPLGVEMARLLLHVVIYVR